jgi:hypothetical protein
MGCCGKTRQQKINELLKRQTIIKKTLKLLEGLYDVDPSSLDNKKLVDYHMKTHMLYTTNIKRKPINKTLINKIVKIHNRLVKIMLNRQIKHNTPLNKI